MDQDEWQSYRNNPGGAAEYFDGPEPPTKQARAYDRAGEDEKLHFAMTWCLQIFDNPHAQVPRSVVFGWDVPGIARCGRRAYEALRGRDGEYMAARLATAAMWEWNVRAFMKIQGRDSLMSSAERPLVPRFENE